jgi:nicotinate-nucleotide adenylyltransferase
VASAVLDKFEMDDLLIIPAVSPPHKDPRDVSGSHHRFAMAAIATLDIPRVRVSEIEIETPAQPYTFETVGRLRSFYGQGAELYFIIGSDSFEELHTWRRPDLILKNCNLIVAARPGSEISNAALDRLAAILEIVPANQKPLDKDNLGKPGGIVDLRGFWKAGNRLFDRRASGLIFLTDYVSADVSSTEIRCQAARGRDIDGMVGRGVAEYIRKYELYKAGGPAEVQ